MLKFPYMPVELLIMFALVVANGLFAGAEIAVLTASKVLIEQRPGRRSLAVRTLREKPERFLATVQIGITVIGAAAAAFGGASIARDLAPRLEPMFGTSAHEVSMVLVVALVSFLSLVLGELVPKSLALRYSTGYALLIAPPLLGLARVMRPLVWFLTTCSNAVLKLFDDKTSFTETRMSREELRELVEEAAKTGSVDQKGSEIAARALEFGDVMVGEVMVRRDRMVAIDRGARPDEVQRLLLEEGHSRMPVYDGTTDQVIGYVVARDVLALAWEQNLITVEDIIRPVIYVPASARISAVLREMQAKRTQLAIIVDEHGTSIGLATIEDVMEELVGEIYGENELPEAELRQEPDGSVLVPGWVPTRKVNRTLQTALPIARESMTIAGLCMALALAVPAIGARLHAPDGTVLEVTDASPRRVRMVRVVRRHEQERETTPKPG
jgi:putative hemolysin